MTFDFFNTSHLAFGSKLTKAFLQLDRLCTEAEENQANLKLILQEYEQYSNRNYKAPFPTRPDAPCRTNEIFDIINDLNSIKYIRLNSEGNLECAINLFKRVSNRFTIASGTTELKEGYASVIDSVSNARPEREIQFTETYPTAGNFLFQFKIEDGNINILGDSKAYFLPGDFNHIIGMEYEKDVSTTSYTAEGDECIVCVGQGGAGADSIWPLTVKVNDKIKVDAKTKNTKNFAVIYPKKGDVITGNMSRAFKIKYLAKEVAIPTPIVPPTVSFEVLSNTYDTCTVNSGSFDSYLNNNGTVSYSGFTTEYSTDFNFKCSDWNLIKSISIGNILGTEYFNTTICYIRFIGNDSSVLSSTMLWDLRSPYTRNLDSVKSLRPDGDFYMQLRMQLSYSYPTPVSVTLSNFSYELA